MIVPAHAGPHAGPVSREEVWQHWMLDPGTLLAVLLASLLYAWAATSVRRRSRTALGPRHLAAFGSGLAVLLVALASPLAGLEGTLLSAHMGQHMLLVAVAAPLLAYGAPPVRMAAVAPRALARGLTGAHRRVGRTPASVLLVALTALAVHAGTVWGWHLPALYEAALANTALHGAQHAAFSLRRSSCGGSYSTSARGRGRWESRP